MVAPRFRASKKTLRRTPGGRQGVIYKPKKPGKAKCAICGTKLFAVPNRSTVGMRKLARTEKRPERVFGGVLCHACVAQILKEKLRLQSGALTKEEIGVVHLKYIGMLK
ncbi:MAG: 50S ribosomal protein L34e [Candidatus Micrarchaeota archaeon]